MPGVVKGPQTLYDKVFESHIVNQQSDGTVLLYIDRHLIHEVTSPVSDFYIEITLADVLVASFRGPNECWPESSQA